MFVMRHKAIFMTTTNPTNTSNSEYVWFVNTGTSNHMMSHEDWFGELQKPERTDYVETGDDTVHPIKHVDNVPFGEEGNQTYIKNVQHVPTIMKDLVSIGHIVEQGMQVHFNDGGCFIEKEG